MAGFCERGNETSGPIKEREFLSQLLDETSALWRYVMETTCLEFLIK